MFKIVIKSNRSMKLLSCYIIVINNGHVKPLKHENISDAHSFLLLLHGNLRENLWLMLENSSFCNVCISILRMHY